MNYLNPPGFLGTGASLLADITLLTYVLLILPGMVAGFVFARNGKHRPHHRNVMMGITLLNWVFILWLMLAALTYDVTPNITVEPDNARYLFPAIHGAIGAVAQILATYAVYRMIREDTQVKRAKARGETQLSKYWFKSAKPVMRIVLLLWIVTSVIGIISYLIRYDVVSIGGAPESGAAPAATPEVVATAEVGAPAETPEVETATQAVAEVSQPTVTLVPEENTAAPTTRPQATTASSTTAPTVASQSTGGEPLVLLGGNDELGAFLTDGEGRTLYIYANDEPGWSNCVGDCLNNWDIYEVEPDTPLVAGEGVLGRLGIFERADGTYQLSYADKPLYYFTLDRNPGDTIGHGADNLWSVVLIQF